MSSYFPSPFTFLPSYDDLVTFGVVDRAGKQLPTYDEVIERKERNLSTVGSQPIPTLLTDDGELIFALSPICTNDITYIPLYDTFHELSGQALQANSPIKLEKQEIPEYTDPLPPADVLIVDNIPQQVPIDLKKPAEPASNHIQSEVVNTPEDTPLPDTEVNENLQNDSSQVNSKKTSKKDKDKAQKKKKGFRSRVGTFLKDARELFDFNLVTPVSSSQIHVYKPGNAPARKKITLTDEELYCSAQECLELSNQFRVENDLPGDMKWSEELYFLACEHSMNMSEKIVSFGHDGFKERVKNFPFTSYKSAENVFMCKGMKTDTIAKAAVDGWISSPGHRANLLGKGFNICSIGVSQSADGYYYFTQLFAQIG
uniref:SCP domain-containing protein n=1 Tax=Vannella robusta TaxID=1487602 RepID=A0A7S4ID92_9EUKA|mmetsp:Transcript_24046/g.30597  ORF Transcript_24046/g.30597 Transcript_24046/m.30597 type:complete len:371 (+) Transcript_24046:3-1115(+)